MLDESNFYNYFKRLSYFIQSSVDAGIMWNVLDESLLRCKIITDLEQSKEDFAYQNDEELFYSAYPKSFPYKCDYTSTMSDWIAHIYLKLFFEFHKSFSFIITYFPVEYVEKIFSPYHEMDDSHLFDLFIERTSKPILPILLKENRLSVAKLSSITGINYYVIEKYARNNKYLYSASYKNIYLIAKALGVKENIFIEKLDLDLFFPHSKNNLLDEILPDIVLATISYNDSEIAKIDFIKESENVFSSEYKTLFFETSSDLERTKNIIKKFDVATNTNKLLAIYQKDENFDKNLANPQYLQAIYILSANSYIKINHTRTSRKKDTLLIIRSTK